MALLDVLSKQKLSQAEYTRFFFISDLGFCPELGLLNSETEIGTGIAYILLVQSGSTFKKSKKRSTCIKSLNRYNLRHNNCVIFSIFL